jgi:RHS repeat-associated protein
MRACKSIPKFTGFCVVAVVAVLAAAGTFGPGVFGKGPDPAESGSAYNEKGYNKDSVYTSIDGPAVNAFNFNFVVDWPLAIGPSYPENAGLALQLSLNYNSRVWHWQNSAYHRRFMRVRRQNPYGLGFDITLGRIIARVAPNGAGPWAYVDSSGAEHVLSPVSAGSTEYRSHDGSHLRGVLTNDSWILSFPNGLVQELDHAHHITGPEIGDLTDSHSPCDANDPAIGQNCPYQVFVADPPGGWQGFDRDYVGWQVSKVYSRAAVNGSAAPSYTVQYYGDDGQNTNFAYVIKSITDQFGRTIQFHLNTTLGVVDSITTPAPATEAGGSRTATYNFDYGVKTLSLYGTSIVARVLTQVSGPDVATSGGAQRYVHAFDYEPGGGTTLGGQLNSITYPSGRLLKISYAEYPFLNGSPGYCEQAGSSGPNPDPDFCNAATNGGRCAHSWGVSGTWTYLDGNASNQTSGNALQTTFRQTTVKGDYVDKGFSCGDPNSNGHRGYWKYDQVNTMTDPSGNTTEFRYRTSKESEDEKFNGLLVSQTYNGGGGNLTLVTTTTAQKTKEVDYHYTELDNSGTTYYHKDFEMVPDTVTTTWWDDDDGAGGALAHPTVMAESRSAFDGFGHYQRAEFSGTAVGDEGKVVIKDYASDNVQYLNGPLCANAATLQSNWLGDVVANDEVHKKVGSTETTLSRSDYGYDATRGLRTTEVHRADVGATVDPCTSAPSANTGDMVTVNTFTDPGDLGSERHYVPGLASTSAPTDVTARFTYSYGARDSGKNDGFAYYHFVRVIDHDSGLATAQREYATSTTDTSAVTTSFAYDVLGRTTKITHGADLPLAITYQNDPSLVLTAPAVMLAHVKSTQGSGVSQTETVDHCVHGRYDHAEKLNPDGSRAYRYTQYDVAGRVASVSEWTRQTSSAGVPGAQNDYLVRDASGVGKGYWDPSGRPTAVTDALGNVTTYRYFGLNKQTTVQQVALKATSLDDPANVKTFHYTDALGRLRIVSAPSVELPSGQGSHGPYEETGAGGVYNYDILGNLLESDISESVTVSPTLTDRYNATATSAQTRTSTYDPLGRLTTTTTPEAGRVTNQAWNALGQVTQVQDAMGVNTGSVHRTTYDAAGRPTKLERIMTAGSAADLVFNPGDSGWGGWRFDNTGSCLGAPAWYVGDTNCQYATSSPASAVLESPWMNLSGNVALTFKLYREVRADPPGSTGRDLLRVLIINNDVTPAEWIEVFRLDSTQASWPKWVQSPVIPLGRYLDGLSKKIRITFGSGDVNATPNLRGVGIGQIAIRNLSSVTLQQTTYDESFGISGNHPRGNATTMAEYDEATLAPIFTRELHYAESSGRLSDEKLTFDWDRDGVNQTLVDDYVYDARGDLSQQHMPHPLGVSTRRYEYSRNHGAVTGITATDEATNATQNLLGLMSFWGPGIDYNDAGGMSAIRFGNGLVQHIEPNSEFLPNRIWVDHGWGDSPAWDTGQYVYDGARNIKQIGQDYYRYDAANRLTWSRVTSNLYGTVDLDQVYDPFGNMTAQTASFPSGGSPTLPLGLTFSGRTYHYLSTSTNNKISGFSYDENGNLTDEPTHESLPAQSYAYTSEGRLAHVSNGFGQYYQNALYEGGDHRWFRSSWSESGSALITLRDASGQVVADYLEANAATGLKLQREYVHANGQLVAINSTCGPRPALANPSPGSGVVYFDKTDYIPAVGNYTMYVKSAMSSEIRTLSLPPDTPNHFSVPVSLLFPGVTNFIQIETDAACGHTGYSNAVSYIYSSIGQPPPGSSCLNSIGSARFSVGGTNLKLSAFGSCPTGTTYNIYFFDPDEDANSIAPLNGSTPVSDPSTVLANIPCGSGNGYYWIRPVSPVTHHEQQSSPEVLVDGTSCSGGGEGANGNASFTPGQPGMNAQYVHWDHLGSTRMMTDENGVPIAAFKYFPFGMEAESSGGDELRQKFTGHERDNSVGLDYMMARSCRMPLGRFLEPDPYDGSMRPEQPQSWNRYAYVSNNPLNAGDPDGYTEETVISHAGGSAGGGREDVQVTSAGNDEPSSLAEGGEAAVDYIGGIARGISSSMSFGYCGGPTQNDSTSSLVGQTAGSILVAITGVTGVAGGGAGALITSPLLATGPGGVVPMAAAGTAAIGAVLTTGAAINIGHVAQMASQKSGGNSRSGSAGGRKSDIRKIDHVSGKVGLNKEQRRLLHREISGRGLSSREIEAVARQIKNNMPKGSGQ